MYPMPMETARQLVADRHATYQASASRHRVRRLFRRSAAEAPEAPAVDAPVGTPRLHSVPSPVDVRRDSPETSERTVA